MRVIMEELTAIFVLLGITNQIIIMLGRVRNANRRVPRLTKDPRHRAIVTTMDVQLAFISHLV